MANDMPVRALPFITVWAIGFIPQTIVFALIGSFSAPNHGVVLGISVAMFVRSALCGVDLPGRFAENAPDQT